MKLSVALSLLTTSLIANVASAEPAFVNRDGVWMRNPHACGTPQVAPSIDPVAIPAPPAVGLRTLYLNRNGGTYTRGGQTNSSTGVVNGQIIGGGQTVTIPPLDNSTFNWTQISTCVRTHFQKYNVRVVETKPTSGDFVEAVVGGDGSEIGFGGGQLFGIAAADNFCNVTERGVAFNFSETHAQVPRRNEELCATIAHEVGHLLALEHEQLPQDILSYVLIADSGTKAFVDQASGCGTSPQDPSGCTCGGATTNSHGRLVQFIGLRATETVPPSMDVTEPGNPLQVPPTFEVVVNATDNMAMSDVRVLLNGFEVGIDTEPEGTIYRITVRNAAEGNHTLTIIATDAAGNTTEQELAIVVKKAATGESCVANEACSGNLCAQLGDERFCTQTCDPAASTCPDGFTCGDAGGQNICIPSEDGGGCCSTGSDPRPAMLMALAIGALLLRRRRPRA